MVEELNRLKVVKDQWSILPCILWPYYRAHVSLPSTQFMCNGKRQSGETKKNAYYAQCGLGQQIDKDCLNVNK